MSLSSIIKKGLGGGIKQAIKSKFGLADKDSTTPPVIPPQLPGNGIFKYGFSPLITGGLGTSACCGLLLAGIGSWQCFAGITPPDPPYTGGGGGIASGRGSSVYIPWPKELKKEHNKRAVVVTVKLSGKKYEKKYVIDESKAGLVVNVLSVVNYTSSKIIVGVSSVNKTVRAVSAVFKSK